MERKNPCIAMVPAPGFSHLLPLIELSKRLVVSNPHFHITFFIPTFDPPSPATHSIFQSLLPQIDYIILSQINMEDLKTNNPATQLLRTVTLSLPSLRHELSSMMSSRTHHFVAMVAHMFSVDAFEIAKEFNLKSYVLHSSSVATLSFFLHFPELDEDHDMVSTGFRELSQPLKLPGCVAFQGKDLPLPVQERSSESYKTFLHMSKRFRFANAIMVNSFLDLEREAIIALQQSSNNQNQYPLVYHVGPLIQTRATNINEFNNSDCLTWLDNQPRNSVLYVSFGSFGKLSLEQLHELALGLEMSGHKFLWVVRAPSESSSSKKEGPLDYLPEGFLERTKGQGFLVPSWAPQIEVLGHKSTGGFLTHCGWKSTLEAMVYGKPMIVWPLFAEQRMNAVMLTEQFKVAVWPKADENKNGIIVRGEVARVVKILLEGDEGTEFQRRIQVFKDSAAKALSEDGSSTRMVSNLAHEWTDLSGK